MKRVCHRLPIDRRKILSVGFQGIAFSLLLAMPFTEKVYAGDNTPRAVANAPRPVKGRVLDAEGKPLQGATVLAKGTTSGTKTDENGAFLLSVPDKATTLVISYVGMETIEVDVRGKSSVTIVMKEAVTQSQDVVVVGYVSQKKSLLTGSVAETKLTEADREIPTTMAGNILAGKLAGVNVSTPSGLPGQSAPNITIRTATSWNGQPVLYVIDGKISGSGDFNNLSPNEIEDVTVLKDAATTAAYGSRAAGGVVMVTTRRGKSGKAHISYGFNTGYDKRGKNEALTTAVESGKLYDQINPNGGPIPMWTQQDLDYFQNNNFGSGYGNGFDQLSIVYRNPITTTHNLSVDGGSDKIKYFVGGSYVNQQGFLNGLNYYKYNLRTNITADVTKDFQLFFGGALNNNVTYSPNWNGSNSPGDLYQKLLVWQPDYPVFTNSGKPIDYGWIANMGATVQGQGGYVHYNYLKPVITLSGTYKIPFIKGLSAKATYSKSYNFNATKTYTTNYMMYSVKQYTPHIWGLADSNIVGSRLNTAITPGLGETVTWGGDKQMDLQLNYEKSFGLHHVLGTLVYESFEATGTGMSASINGFPLYTTDQWWAATSNQNTVTASGSVVPNKNVSNSTAYSDVTSGRRSWVGQFLYDYADKYIAGFTYRYDGSMNFAPNERWGFFPSGSLGWVLSKEKFMQQFKDIDMLKVRASVGLIGNDNIGGWQWQQSYVSANSAFLGTSPGLNPGLTYGAITNPSLTWERSLNKNIGVDVNFLKHFFGTAEYWHTYTYDILGARIQVVPPTFSRALPAVNYGKEKAQGMDFNIGYSNRFGNVNLSTSIVASYGYAWYVQRDQNVTYDYQNQIGGGRTTTMIAGYKVDHMIRTQADLTAFTGANPNYTFNGYKPDLGQFVYRDINSQKGVGSPDGKVDPYDVAILRKNNDPVVLGWNVAGDWKGFSLAATFAGNVRQWSGANIWGSGVEWNRMWRPFYANSWSASNPNAYYPRFYGAESGAAVDNAGSNFWYRPSSFLRLKQLNLSYMIPSRLYKNYFSAIKVYASGSNLFILSKFNKTFYDPEMSGGTAFPIIKSFNAGVLVSM